MHRRTLIALSLLTLAPLLPGCAALPSPGSLDASDREVLSLRGLVLVDGRGDTTRLSLSNVQIGAMTDDTLFELPGA